VVSREHTEQLAEIKRGGNAEIRRQAELVARIEQAAGKLSAGKTLALLSLVEELMDGGMSDAPVTIVPVGARISVREIAVDNATVRFDANDDVAEVEFHVPVEVA
jgi:hypothetical protein